MLASGLRVTMSYPRGGAAVFHKTYPGPISSRSRISPRAGSPAGAQAWPPGESQSWRRALITASPLLAREPRCPTSCTWSLACVLEGPLFTLLPRSRFLLAQNSATGMGNRWQHPVRSRGICVCLSQKWEETASLT